MTHYFKSEKRFWSKKLISVSIRGVSLTLLSSSGLFSKNKVDVGTRILLENLRVPEKGVVLDLGCGYGIIGLFIAKLNPNIKVYMVDANKLAVKTARENAKLNKLEDKVVVLESNLYERLQNIKFNAIYTNPPLSCGWSVVEKIIEEAPKHLVNKGFMEAVFAKGEDKAVKIASKFFSRIEVVKRKSGYTVLLFIK